MPDPPDVPPQQEGKKGGGKGRKKGGGKGGKGGKGDGACFKCGEHGHISRNCPNSSREPQEVGGKGKGYKGGKKEGKRKQPRPPREEEPEEEEEEQEQEQKKQPPSRPRPIIKSEHHTELAQTSIESLINGTYECLICVQPIKSRQATWDCKKCFIIFHLKCVKEWGRSGTGGFRCPQCSEVYPSIPNKYQCFCRKVRDPQDDGYSTPHSCGDPCGLSKGEGCPHKCTELCHPGPCPPCKELGPVRTCHCGALEYQNRCGEEDTGRSCGNKCLRLLNCGKHYCQQECHAGECPPCPKTFKQKCFCGNVVDENRACDGAEQFFSDDEEEEEEEDEEEGESVEMIPKTFSCEQRCEKLRDCGKHKCGMVCHLGPCRPCELGPEQVTTCPCGKRTLRLLTKNVRKSCTDPIAVCQGQCGKREVCDQHPCQAKCHEGECGPCKALVAVTCRCGAATLKLQCSTVKGLKEPPKCQRRCQAMKNCGRHKCNDVCCATSRGGQGASHICMERCRRKLDCGRHNCEERCHPGNCAPCRHIVVDDLKCRCGAEVLEPPQPCGTEPPACSRPCSIPSACGHELPRHDCHYGDCPPCTILVDKPCAGGHTTLRVPCHRKDPCCPAECGKLLPCGRHYCKKKCHPGDCPPPTPAPTATKKMKEKPPTETCCGVCEFKLPCEHPCQLPCHGPDTPHTTTCNFKVGIKCQCGRMTEQIACHKYYAKMRAGAGKKGGSGMVKPTIPCNDDCAHANKLEAMREAFGIDRERANTPFVFAGSLTPLKEVVYTQDLWIANQQNPSHVQLVEKTFRDLLIGAFNSHMTAAMNKDKRAVFHALGPYYNLSVVSLDSEPNRTCQITKTPNSAVPTPLLSEWSKDPLELAQDRATHFPDSCIIFTGFPSQTKDMEFARLLRTYSGRWIGFRKSPREYCVAFMDSQDCKHCLNFLNRERVPYQFQPFSEHQSAEQGRLGGVTRVVQANPRRLASESSGGPPTTAGVWQNFFSQKEADKPKSRQKAPARDPGVPLSSNKWSVLGKK